MDYVYKFNKPLPAFVTQSPIEELFGKLKKQCYHNIVESFNFSGKDYVVRIVKSDEDIKYMISKVNKNKNAFIAWDAESLNALRDIHSLQFSFGGDEVFFVFLAYDCYARNEFLTWFPNLMSKSNLKVTFAQTETDFLLKVFDRVKGKWLRIGSHVDVQQLLFSKTHQQMGLQLAYNCFFSKIQWKKGHVVGEQSIDVIYGCIDAIATYRVAEKVILESELFFAHDIQIMDKDIMQQQIDNSDVNVADIDGGGIKIIQIEDDISACNLTNVEEVSNVENSKFSVHNDFVYDGINFQYVDYKFADYLIDLGLIDKRYEKVQFKNFYINQNDDYKTVFKQILEVFLLNEKMIKKESRKQEMEEVKLPVQEEPDPSLENVLREQSKQEAIERDKKKQLGTTIEFLDNNSYVKLLNADYTVNEQQKYYALVKELLKKDDAARNRCVNGSVLQELTNLGIRYEITIVQQGLSHQPAFDVTLEIKRMGIKLHNLGVNKQTAKNVVLKQLTQSLFNLPHW